MESIPLTKKEKIVVYPAKKSFLFKQYTVYFLAEGIIVLFLVLTFLTLNYFNVIAISKNNPQLFGWLPYVKDQTNTSLEKQLVTVPFDYTVQKVTDEEATLNGEKGTMVIPNNPSVEVYKGLPPKTESVPFNNLSVGQKIKLELIPGRSAKLYIIE